MLSPTVFLFFNHDFVSFHVVLSELIVCVGIADIQAMILIFNSMDHDELCNLCLLVEADDLHPSLIFAKD
jgi:hypothetical protein